MTTENKPHDCPLTAECLDDHAQQARDAIDEAMQDYADTYLPPKTAESVAELVENLTYFRAIRAELEAFAYARGRWEGFGSAPAEAKLRAAIAAIVRRAG